MSPNNALYFIALLPDYEISNHVAKLKDEIKTLFGCQSSLKSPAHITLVPPFNVSNNSELEDIYSMINLFAINQKAFSVTINGWHNFGTQTIYLGCDLNPELLNSVNFFHSINMIKFNRKEKEFIPHLTIANRDIKDSFTNVWQYLISKNYPQQIQIKLIAVFKFIDQQWNTIFFKQLSIE